MEGENRCCLRRTQKCDGAIEREYRDPTHQHALVDCLHGDLGGRSIAEVAKVEENAASGSYRGCGLVASPSARIVVVSRGRSRRAVALCLAIPPTLEFSFVRAEQRTQPPSNFSVHARAGGV